MKGGILSIFINKLPTRFGGESWRKFDGQKGRMCATGGVVHWKGLIYFYRKIYAKRKLLAGYFTAVGSMESNVFLL